MPSWFHRSKKRDGEGSPPPEEDSKQPAPHSDSKKDSKDSKHEKGQQHISQPSHTAEDYDAPPPAYSEYAAGPSSSSTPAGTSSSSAPPAPADWESAVPDTSSLPPPPNVFAAYELSPARNASEDSLKAGMKWCKEHPLYAPLTLAPDHLSALSRGDITLFAPEAFQSKSSSPPRRLKTGRWQVLPLTKRPFGREEEADYCLATYPPLYSVRAHHPLHSPSPPSPATHIPVWWTKQIYYELNISPSTPSSSGDIPLAIGYAANPYPYFRLPGWHRASLGVHGDDGHRYVNDHFGGREFTSPFRAGETVGLGMRFGPGAAGGSGKGLGVKIYIFFTRDGREVGGWDLHEENDSQSVAQGGVEGLDGNRRDVSAAIGVYGRVEFEAVFDPNGWKWQGWRQ